MDQYRIPYMNMIVREFGRRYKMTVQQAFRYLYRFKGIQHLDDFYDVEHLLPVDDTLHGLVAVCHKNGGRLR
ncbi:MAG: DUF3791 domain-containing protein [Prevotella sp.]|nr:DUF3791 domain-containing protein [Prevotella sp.]